jgi:hypothetical protein
MIPVSDFINKWLLFPWLKNSGRDDLVYEEDLQKVEGISVVKCIDVSNGYLVVLYKGQVIRVRSEGVKRVLPGPKFLVSEQVLLKGKDNVSAVINDFFWHYKNEQYLYYLSKGGKKESKRYAEDELEKGESSL